MMKKKIIAMVLVLTMATGLMTGCGSKGTEKTEQKDADTSADTTENITVTMASNPFVGLAPFYVAMDKGFFKDCGLDYLNDAGTHDEAVEIVAKHLEVSADEADSMISTIKLYLPEDSSAELKEGGLVYQAVGKISQFYLDRGIIEKSVEPAQLLVEK